MRRFSAAVAGMATFVLAAALASPAEAAGGPVAGSIVRWPSPEAQRCGMDGRRWEPIEGTCYFPVGLDASGSVEVAVLRGGTWEERTVRLGDYPYPVQRLTLEDDSYVHLSKEDLARVERENRKIGALWHRPAPRRFQLPLSPPLDRLPPGGRFGSRRIINGEPRSAHSGADYAADTGTPVQAMADGVVQLAEDFFFSGKSVFIDHGDELVSMFFHLSQIAVEPGQEVKRGQVIGKVGSTGRSTGPHLHVGVRWHGEKVDPALLLGPLTDLPEVGP